MLNARGPQDLVVYALTKNGRVETTNYRTVKLPANVELPTYTRAEFGKFYKALFETPVEARGLPRRLDRVFLGHGLVRSHAPPIRFLPRSLGAPAFSGSAATSAAIGVAPGTARRRSLRRAAGSGAQPVMLTRLHLRYTRRRCRRT